MVEGFVQLRTFIRQNSVNHLDARALQNLKTFAGVIWIRVGRADDDAFDAGGNNRVRARRRAAMRATWFERDVKRRAARRVAAFLGVTERLDFCVRQTGTPMPAASNDFSVFHQHRADERIGRSRAGAASGEPEGEAQEWGVGHRVHRSGCGAPAQTERRRMKFGSTRGRGGNSVWGRENIRMNGAIS